MSDLSKTKFAPNITYLDNSKSKVYINPNFNRQDVPYNRVLPNNAAMHVNPKFSHLITNMQHNSSNKTKIYVNPNFIKPTKSVLDNSLCTSTSVNQEVCSNKIINTINYESRIPSTTTGYKPINNIPTQLPAPITKSRYCLVRKKATKEPDKTSEQSNTFKINKYKSVPWKDVKHNLEFTVPNKNMTVQRTGYGLEKHSKSPKTDSGLFKSCVTVNRYKLVNHHNKLPILSTMVKTKPFVVTKVVPDLHKKPVRLNRSLIRTKKMKIRNLKKNNIPCPLFRKFGTCLRNNTGNCEFLHDKKHVSVCRKFIKGICHDSACLLSHNLTLQKMPTCYFYLQGTCLKEGCPYLHVKLNENTKICPDFLKGYCEKGSKCLYRHMTVKKQNKKETLQSKNKNNITNRIKIGNVRDKVIDHKDGDMKQVAMQNQNNESALVTEYRYYQENKKDEDTSTNDMVYEVIKPVRCKLGTLPSFIQL